MDFNILSGMEAFAEEQEIPSTTEVPMEETVTEEEEIEEIEEIIELTEELVTLTVESARLDRQLGMLLTMGSIAAYAQSENAKIGTGLEALFSKDCMEIAGMYDTENAVATGKAIEAGLEGYKEKMVTTVKAIVEKIRILLESIVYNRDKMNTKIVKATAKLQSVKNLTWKSSKVKVIKFPGEVSDTMVKEVLNGVVMLTKDTVDLSKFDGSKLSPSFVDGSILATLRKKAAQVEEYKTGGNSRSTFTEMQKRIDEAVKKLNETTALKDRFKQLRVVSGKMENAGGAASMSPTKAFSMAASVCSWYGLYYLKTIAAALKVLNQLQ